MTSISATDARTQLPALLDRVEKGEEVTITRHGKAVATLTGPRKPRNAAAAAILAEAAKLREQLDQAAREPLVPATLTQEYADELLREIRADRDRDPWTASTQTS